MNTENLHALIEKYENNLHRIYGADADELYKWRAMKTWRQEWFRPQGSFGSFGARYFAAKKDFGGLMDDSRMHPSAGVVDLWNREPAEVERLFEQVLFAGAGGDPGKAQADMDAFLDGYEALRKKYCPGTWAIKQDRHSASVFMALNEPEFNYAYKAPEAAEMARYIGFGQGMGPGAGFSLGRYYRMCDGIVEALREHPTLLEKHFAALDGRCYEDRSLHLLAYDLICCSRTYAFYQGLTAPAAAAPVPKRAAASPSGAAVSRAERARANQEELTRQEEERAARARQMDALRGEIRELEEKAAGFEEIPLIGVQVTSDRYGTGVVEGQTMNRIRVRFPAAEVTFTLSKRFPVRPRFEDDEAVVEAFAGYDDCQVQLQALKKQLDALERQERRAGL